MTTATEAKTAAAATVTMRKAFGIELSMRLAPHDQCSFPNMHKPALWFHSGNLFNPFTPPCVQSNKETWGDLP